MDAKNSTLFVILECFYEVVGLTSAKTNYNIDFLHILSLNDAPLFVPYASVGINSIAARQISVFILLVVMPGHSRL